jgi:stearoyl-CoA desaturase (delta-9 desaturase)
MFLLTAAVAVIVVPWYGLTVGYSAAAWVWFAVLLYANGLAITTGYHRLWSHKTYDAHWSVRLILMIFGTMALQNSILVWSSNHRSHHVYVDDNERDPYSAGRGLWFSHIGWMLRSYKSSVTDFSNVRDLQKDPIVAFQHRWYLPLALALNFGLPLALGWLHDELWGMFLLAGVLRLVVSHHFTFLINSFAHAFGRQPYSDEHSARDSGWLAFLTYGEGYHNFHHQFAHDYRNGIRWWQWDPSKWIICSLSWVGLTTKLRRTPAVVIQRARLAMQFRAQAGLPAPRRPRAHPGDDRPRVRAVHGDSRPVDPPDGRLVPEDPGTARPALGRGPFPPGIARPRGGTPAPAAAPGAPRRPTGLRPAPIPALDPCRHLATVRSLSPNGTACSPAAPQVATLVLPQRRIPHGHLEGHRRQGFDLVRCGRQHAAARRSPAP